MKKKRNAFEDSLYEIHNVVDMLKAEGKSYAECRYMKIMAERLLLIDDSLRIVRSLLFGLAGCLIGRIISSALF